MSAPPSFNSTTETTTSEGYEPGEGNEDRNGIEKESNQSWRGRRVFYRSRRTEAERREGVTCKRRVTRVRVGCWSWGLVRRGLGEEKRCEIGGEDLCVWCWRYIPSVWFLRFRLTLRITSHGNQRDRSSPTTCFISLPVSFSQMLQLGL